MTAVFDGHFHAPFRWRDVALLNLLKTRWDGYRKYRDEEAIYEDYRFEADYQGLEAMAHWHDPEPSPCRRRCRHRHILEDNPCSG